MSDAPYYYSRQGQRLGPVPEEQLKAMALSGQLAPSDLVWKKGFAKWVPASEVAGLMPGDAAITAAIPESPAVTDGGAGPLTAVAAEAPPGIAPRAGAGLPGWTKRPMVWIAAGGGVLLLGLLCCTGSIVAFVLFNRSSGERLIGTWEGQKEEKFFWGRMDHQIEFKRGGRVTWTQTLKAMPEMPLKGAGTWKVDRVEGDKYILHIVNDSEPDRTYGWTLTFEGKDRFTLEEANESGFEFLPLPFERKR
jgi:hypothetical protein